MIGKFNRVFPAILIAGLSLSVRAEVEVKVHITDIKNDNGTIHVSLFSEELQDGFPEGKPLEKKIVDAKKEGVTVVFQISEPGSYAISVMHDENNNGEIDKNFIGIPEEPYGNSGKRVRMKPTYKDSAFTVRDRNLELNITIH